jgi:hypothetical protein
VGTFLPEDSIDPLKVKVDVKPVVPDLRSNEIQDKDLIENALGFPAEQLARTVTIKQECKPASQAGRSARHKKWTSMLHALFAFTRLLLFLHFALLGFFSVFPFSFFDLTS